MTKQQIIEIIKSGGHIAKSDYNTAATVTDNNGKYLGACPIATLESVATLEGMREWVTDYGTRYVARENSKFCEDQKNRLHCKSIADDIDDYVSGRVFKCPECGEIITVNDDREKHLCSCGYVDDIDEFEQLSIYDYLEDVLDIEYRIGSDKELRSVQIMVACGGPNIYLDTASKRVELYWWGDSADYPLSSDAVASIDEWVEELYNI
jgi:predicted RNA-binding Zn-ribbon protein involved in translation (DUF1610 family)